MLTHVGGTVGAPGIKDGRKSKRYALTKCLITVRLNRLTLAAFGQTIR